MKKKHDIPTPPPAPAEPELTAATARKALAFDLRNLLVKVKSGKPLTRYERQIIEAKVAPDGRPSPQASASYAGSAAELARVLGTSRQAIAYHNRQPGSPGRREDGRYPVGEWREYLAVNGRIPIAEGETSPGPASASYGDIADFAAQRGVERACSVLPLVIGEALEGRMTEQEQAKLASEIWAAMCCRLTGFLCSDGPRSVPMETPPQIRAMCSQAGVACPVGIDIGMDDATEP